MSASPFYRELQPAPEILAVFNHLRQRPYALLLDSAGYSHAYPEQSHSSSLARYSSVAANPIKIFVSTGSAIHIIDGESGTIVRETGRLLDVARKDLQARGRWGCTPAPHLPPFQGGLAGYVGYEYGGMLERIPRAEATSYDAPDVVLADYSWVVAWDHYENKAWVIGDDESVLDQLVGELQSLAPFASMSSDVSNSVPDDNVVSQFASTLQQPQYEHAIERIHEYIAAGDVFQINVAQQFSLPFSSSPWTLYQHLRTINPAPFAAYFDAISHVIVSASPERFLHSTHTGFIETRPIKGTRPRGENHHLDLLQQRDLQQSEKDSAEHVMIVDVLRNDLARVCEYGSVSVPQLMALESYPTVHHLVSTVTGQLRTGCDTIDLLHASFPGGSITGAPKVRAMEIIAELEPVTRNVYCGTIGYFSVTGAMDSSIVIRTCVISNNTVYFSAGGGVVYDSTPTAEYRESIDKALALIHAIVRTMKADAIPPESAVA